MNEADYFAQFRGDDPLPTLAEIEAHFERMGQEMAATLEETLHRIGRREYRVSIAPRVVMLWWMKEDCDD